MGAEGKEASGDVDTSVWSQLLIDDSKTLAVLEDFAATFEEILGCLDANDAEGGATLERILADMRAPTPFVLRMVELCNSK